MRSLFPPCLIEQLQAAVGEEEEESAPEDVDHKEGGEAQTMLEKNFVSDGIMFVDSSAPNANGHAHHNGIDDNSASHSMRQDRPSSRRRGGFANELRKVTSAMSAVEAFSIEEIVEMMNVRKLLADLLFTIFHMFLNSRRPSMQILNRWERC